MNDWAIQLKNTKHIPVKKIPETLKGTTFQGYINISVNNLRNLFGEPTRKNTDILKTYLEWDLECDGIIFAIYDYNTWDNENEIDTMMEEFDQKQEEAISGLKSSIIISP